MKILYHISSLYGGGAERVMSYLINHSVENGNEVYVVVCYEHEGEYFISDKTKKIVIGQSNLLTQSFKLRKVIKNIKPDLCIAFMQGGNFRMSFANLFRHQKYILSIRNEPTKEYPSKISQFIAKKLFKKASGIVFQTPDAQNYFCKKIQKKSTVIFNPVNQDFFVSNRPTNQNGIVTFGRLVQQKNFKLLIESFSLISKDIEDDLYIYGEGPLEESLKQYINMLNLNDRVHLMGRTNNVKNILLNSKMFVMSSDFEGMPNALLEAVCTLTPSISTDCPCGGSKIILSGDVGLLVPMNDPIKLAESIKYIANNLEVRNKFIENAKRSRQKFNTNEILEKWDEFFQVVKER